MQQRLLIIFSVLFIFFMQPSFATESNGITLPKYYQANCQAYTGTWQGFMADPQGLFGNGGPWPVVISLYNRDTNIIGQGGGAPVGNKKIWAQCHNGVLSNIFWGNKAACGDFSQKGLLVSKNVLVLELHDENAMTGTNILLFLQRKNNAYLYTIPSNQQDYQLGEIKSCH
jgi:hypothetical protein